tara:strand:- start:583 stop:744 length:162 start_codon:yes stop_codon:yes gene_type:complete
MDELEKRINSLEKQLKDLHQSHQNLLSHYHQFAKATFQSFKEMSKGSEPQQTE